MATKRFGWKYQLRLVHMLMREKEREREREKERERERKKEKKTTFIPFISILLLLLLFFPLKLVGFEHMEAAIDRIIGGIEKKDKVLSFEEKERIAHHEAGKNKQT